MKKIILRHFFPLAAVVAFSSTAFAQPSLEWAAPQTGTTSGDASTSLSIYIDPSGNTYTVGRFAGTVDFDPTPGVDNITSSSSLDIYVSKKDVLGNLVWVKNFGTSSVEVNEITGDSAGNIYITGGFQNTIDFDPGPGVSSLSSNGFQDVYILKLDGNGIFQWVQAMGDVNFDRAKAIHYDELNDQLLVVGDFSGTVDFDPSAAVYNVTSNGTDGFLLSLNASGAFQWVQQFTGSSAENIEGVTNDSNGNIFITGFFFSDIDLDPGIGFQGLTSLGSHDVFVCKLNNIGNYIWGAQFGDTGNDKSWDIDVDSDNSILITGEYTNTIAYTDVNSNTMNISSNGSIDMFTCKLNNNGEILWVASIGGAGNDRAYSVVTMSGLVYVGGYYSDFADFDPGPSIVNLTSAGSGTNACLYSLNSNGGYLWANSFGNSGSSNNDQISDVHVDNQGNVFATGYFTGTVATVDLDPGPGAFNVQGAQGNNNAFTIKLGCSAVTEIDVVSGSCPYTWIDGNTYFSDNNTATWTLINQYGCDSVVTLNLTITDAIAPVADIGTLADITAECEVTMLTSPTATDACAGAVLGTHNAILPITSQGTTTVTWTYSDGNGNTSTQTQDVIIDDVTAPIADVASLSDVTAECEVTSLTAPTATDNCAGTITGTHGVTLPITSTTTIIWTYNDGNGNTSTQTQQVIIDDVTAPIADVASLSDVTAECEVTSLTAPTATDNCVGAVTGTHSATLPITSTTTITWTYDDGNGNTSTQTQDVVITDGTAPVADVANLSDINSECEVTPTAPTATDNCAGAITGTPDVTFPITATGATTVTWTYDDGNGNISTQTQEVIITPIDNSVTVVDDITLSADVSGYTYQWVDCEDNNAPIAGETNQTFEATANGSYAVIIDNGDCNVISACVVINQVGISEIEDAEFVEVYPNPTTGIILISSSVPFNRVEVMNSLGQKVVESNISETSKHSLTLPEQNGVYFVKVYSYKTTIIKKIIKH